MLSWMLGVPVLSQVMQFVGWGICKATTVPTEVWKKTASLLGVPCD